MIKIFPFTQVEDLCKTVIRWQPRKVVLASGCFDILTLGHCQYLEKARAMGDVLIVGINSDESVRRLKGPTRPVNPERDRAAVLAALSCVDYVTVFHGDTVDGLLRAVRPDVWCKGTGYSMASLPTIEVAMAHQVGCRIVFDPEKYSKSSSEVFAQTKCKKCDSLMLDGICQNYGCEGTYKTS